jgi:hypothetical protein
MRVEQRIGRIDRVGQRAQRLSIVNFKVKNTIEERLYDQLHSKLERFANSLGDLEAIIGKEVQQLTVGLLSQQLTPEEEARLMDQSEQVIEQRLIQIQALEESGNPRWRRLPEVRAGSAKSVFHFDVQGSVAKSTHAGLPWLRCLRRRLGDRAHFWPFDGWDIPVGRSAVVEVYPSLWRHNFPRDGRTADQHDAYSVAEWMRHADLDGNLAGFLNPPLDAGRVQNGLD